MVADDELLLFGPHTLTPAYTRMLRHARNLTFLHTHENVSEWEHAAQSCIRTHVRRPVREWVFYEAMVLHVGRRRAPAPRLVFHGQI